MSTLRLLRTFVAVAQGGSFSAASELVSVTPAAVSLQMRSLEQELRQTLFDRRGHVVTLNERGHHLLPGAQQMLKLYDELRNDAMENQELVGSLNIGAVGSSISLLAHIVLKMRKLYPRLVVNLSVNYAGDLSKRVQEGELDAALSVKGPHKLHPGLLWTALYEEPLVFISSKNTRKTADYKTLLSEHPFLRPSRNTRTGGLIDRFIRRHRLQVNDFMELNSLRTIIDLVQRNVGVSIIPLRRDAIQIPETLLRVVHFEDQGARRSIGLFENSGRSHLTSVLRKLLLDEISNSKHASAVSSAK